MFLNRSKTIDFGFLSQFGDKNWEKQQKILLLQWINRAEGAENIEEYKLRRRREKFTNF